MSRPENPLARYRTYSYQHIMMACSSTDVAAALSSADTEFSSILDLRSTSDPYKPIDVAGGKLVIVIDSRTDAHYFIDEFTMETQLINNGSAGMGAATATAQGSFTVYEPISAATFILQLRFITESLGLNSGLDSTYVMKTLFYGYNDDGTYDVISTVPGWTFGISGMNANFTEKGSEYSIECIGLGGGSGTNAKYASLDGLATSIAITKSNTLKDVLADYETQQNAAYKKKIEEALKKQIVGNENLPSFLEFKIVLQPPYDDPSYVLDDISAHQSVDGRAGEYSVGQPVTFGPAQDLQGGIMAILDKCSKITKGATADPKKITTYRVQSEEKINSAEAPNKHLIVYTVSQFTINKNPRDLAQLAKDNAEKDRAEAEAAATVKQLTTIPGTSTGEVPPAPVPTVAPLAPPTSVQAPEPDIEGMLYLDYLYTGKNTDILSFDMTLNDLSLILTATPDTSNTESKPATLPLGSGNVVPPVVPSAHGGQENGIAGVGQFMAAAGISHSATPTSRSGFYKEMSNFVAMQKYNLAITIMGNPSLFGSFTSNVTQKWHKTPYLCKIDVKTMDPDNLQLSPFWLYGYYNIFSVKSVFSGGSFTQDLELQAESTEQPYTQPVDDPIPKPREQASPPPKSTSVAAYATTEGCFVTPPAGMKYEELFIAATQKYSLPCGLLSRICQQETHYNNILTYNSAGATGLMQFVPVVVSGKRKGQRNHPDSRWWKRPADQWSPHDPAIVIDYAGAMLRYLHDAYNWDWPKTVAAYNAGEGTVLNAVKNGGDNWIGALPSQETKNYVAQVGRDTNLNPQPAVI